MNANLYLYIAGRMSLIQIYGNHVMRLKKLCHVYRKRILFLWIVFSFLLGSTAVQSRDVVDVLTTPFIDPLLSQPPQLANISTWSAGGRTQSCSKSSIDEALKQVLTLEKAIELALCHSPQIQGAQAAIQVQAAALGETRAAYLPVLNASASRLQDKIRYPDRDVDMEINSSTFYGSLTWRLLDFGERRANHRSATALLDAAMASHHALSQKILIGIIRAYFDAQTAFASWQGKTKNEDIAQQILTISQRREARGAGSQIETLQASTAWMRATLEKNRAQAGYQKACALLARALNLPAQTPLQLPLDNVNREGTLDQDLNAWLTKIQKYHPALIAARQQVVAAEEKISATRANGLPSLDLTANFYKNGQPNRSLTPNTTETLAGLTLNIPFFDGFARTYKVRGAQAQLEQKKADLANTEQQILEEVTKAYIDASAALTNLEASKNYLDNTSAALDSLQRKFSQGAADLSITLKAQTEFSEAQQERVRCLSEWRAAQLVFLAYAGELHYLNSEE